MKPSITHVVLQSSSLYLDLSDALLTKIDLYLCNADLTKKQKQELINILQDVHSEGYVNSLVEGPIDE